MKKFFCFFIFCCILAVMVGCSALGGSAALTTSVAAGVTDPAAFWAEQRDQAKSLEAYKIYAAKAAEAAKAKSPAKAEAKAGTIVPGKKKAAPAQPVTAMQVLGQQNKLIKAIGRAQTLQKTRDKGQDKKISSNRGEIKEIKTRLAALATWAAFVGYADDRKNPILYKVGNLVKGSFKGVKLEGVASNRLPAKFKLAPNQYGVCLKKGHNAPVLMITKKKSLFIILELKKQHQAAYSSSSDIPLDSGQALDLFEIKNPAVAAELFHHLPGGVQDAPLKVRKTGKPGQP